MNLSNTLKFSVYQLLFNSEKQIVQKNCSKEIKFDDDLFRDSVKNCRLLITGFSIEHGWFNDLFRFKRIYSTVKKPKVSSTHYEN